MPGRGHCPGAAALAGVGRSGVSVQRAVRAPCAQGSGAADTAVGVGAPMCFLRPSSLVPGSTSGIAPGRLVSCKRHDHPERRSSTLAAT